MLDKTTLLALKTARTGLKEQYREVSWSLVFNAQLAGTVISRRSIGKKKSMGMQHAISCAVTVKGHPLEDVDTGTFVECSTPLAVLSLLKGIPLKT